ncbi:MAG: YCF48-related protein [Vicinamibacterales bacterium]
MKADNTRDQALERLLRRSLGAGSQADVSPECLDAETFAMWADGGLLGAALEMAESHVSGCARCQAMAAVMTRTAPVAPVAVPWWRRSLRSAWLVPVTAGAAAVALWSVVPNQSPIAPPPGTTVNAPAEQPAVPAKPESQPAFADRLAGRADAPAKDKVMANPSAQPARERAEFAQGKRQSADGRQTADSSTSLKAGERRGNESRDQARQSGAAAGPDTAAARALPQSAAAAPPPSATAPASPRSAEPASSREMAGALMKQEVALHEIASPDPTIRWRIGSGGLIDRTGDGGKTWTRLSSGVIADLVAGVSPSAPVCWVVGRDSTVLRTTDGRNWARVNIPEVADLVAVEALDAATAVVSASDGRKFRTTSGGQTWIRQAP